jgi:hypothetical protein
MTDARRLLRELAAWQPSLAAGVGPRSRPSQGRYPLAVLRNSPALVLRNRNPRRLDVGRERDGLLLHRAVPVTAAERRTPKLTFDLMLSFRRLVPKAL